MLRTLCNRHLVSMQLMFELVFLDDTQRRGLAQQVADLAGGFLFGGHISICKRLSYATQPLSREGRSVEPDPQQDGFV